MTNTAKTDLSEKAPLSNITDASAAAMASGSSDSAGQISAKHAAAILQFLQRTQLQGAEMPAYVEIFNILSGIVAAPQSDESTA